YKRGRQTIQPAAPSQLRPRRLGAGLDFALLHRLRQKFGSGSSEPPQRRGERSPRGESHGPPRRFHLHWENGYRNPRRGQNRKEMWNKGAWFQETRPVRSSYTPSGVQSLRAHKKPTRHDCETYWITANWFGFSLPPRRPRAPRPGI